MSVSELLESENYSEIVSLYKNNSGFQNASEWNHGYLVSLLKTGNVSEAANFCSSAVSQIADAKEKEFYHFCWSYSLYRLKNYDSSFQMLQTNCNLNDLSRMHLKAQLLFRLENGAECCKIYENILRMHSDMIQNPEFFTNYLASLPSSVCGMPKEQELNAQAQSFESYEVLYNLGCFFANCQKFFDAEKALLKSLELATSLFSQCTCELSEEECEAELSLIKCQLSFVYFRLDKIDEALKLIDSIKMYYDPSAAYATQLNQKFAKGTALSLPEESELNFLNAKQRKKVLRFFCFVKKDSRLMERFINENPSDAESFGFQAFLFMKSKQFENAYDAITKAPSFNSFFSLLKVKILLKLARYQEAVNLAQEYFTNEILFELIYELESSGILKDFVVSKLKESDEKVLFFILSHLLYSKKFNILLQLFSLVPALSDYSELQALKVICGEKRNQPIFFELPKAPTYDITQLLLEKTVVKRKSHAKNPEPKQKLARIDPERWISKANRTSNKKNKKKSSK